MPFLNPDHKPQIMHPQGREIDVDATFNTVGNVRIDYFRIEDDTQERFTFKLTSSRLRHERNYIMTFDCVYVAYGRKNFIVLLFDVTQHRWTVG
jgi:hypothetical protein